MSEARAVPASATIFPNRRALPEFHLVDQENRPFTLDSLRGRTHLLFFGFTHCPDICPATLQQLALARRELAAARDGGEKALPGIVLISVDPARDTPAALARYVEYFGSGITGVTGDASQVKLLADTLGIHFERTPAAGGSSNDDYSVSHSAVVLVVDPEAKLQAIFSAPYTVEAFVHDLPLLMAAK